MMAPPKTFAAAAVSPSSTLVRMGDIRKKDIRKEAKGHEPRATSPEPKACLEPKVRFRWLHVELLTFHGADLVATHRMAGLCCVFDDSCFLADDSSLC